VISASSRTELRAARQREPHAASTFWNLRDDWGLVKRIYRDQEKIQCAGPFSCHQLPEEDYELAI